MKIHEFQAKAILAEFGVPVPRGRVAASAAEARAIAQELDGTVVVKAQIHAGGRGKGGGVKLAKSPDEAEEAARQILGMMLRTHQTGPEGQRVKRVLVEEGMEILQELYLGIVIDRAAGLPVIMASRAGGMEIEEVARVSPEKIVKVQADPLLGLGDFQAAFGNDAAEINTKNPQKNAKVIIATYQTLDHKKRGATRARPSPHIGKRSNTIPSSPMRERRWPISWQRWGRTSRPSPCSTSFS